MVLSPFGLIGALVSLGACAAAMRLGGKPERLAAANLLIGLVLVPVIQDRAVWIDPQFRLGAVDLEIFAAFAWLTSATRRVWVLYATAFQLLSLLAEVLHAFDPRVGGRAFLTVVFMLGYAVDAALALERCRSPQRSQTSSAGAWPNRRTDCVSSSAMMAQPWKPPGGL